MSIATTAGSAAGAKVAKTEAIKAVRMIAAETASKSVKEKLLAMASKGTIKLSADWKPTALISVIGKNRHVFANGPECPVLASYQIGLAKNCSKTPKSPLK